MIPRGVIFLFHSSLSLSLSVCYNKSYEISDVYSIDAKEELL